MASTTAFKTIATMDQSIVDIQNFYSTPGTDQEILRPIARGLDPFAVASVKQVYPSPPAIPGQSALFTLSTMQDFLHEIKLHLDLTAITGVANAAWRDDISGCILQARILQNSQEIHRFAANDWLPFRNQCLLSFEKQQAKQVTEGLGLTLAQRQVNASVPSSYDIELPTLLDQLAVPITCLGGNFVQLEISFKPLLQWCTWTGAGVPSFQIASSYINCHGINVSPEFTDRITEYSRVKPYEMPMIDIAFQRALQPVGGTSIAPQVTQFKGLAAYVGAWIRESQQVGDNTGNSLFQWDNSSPWIDIQIFDRSGRIMSDPNALPYSYVRNIIRPTEFKTYANPALNGIENCALYNFGLMPHTLQNTIGSVLQLGCYNFQTTTAANIQINILPAVTPLTLDMYEVFFNVLVLMNGRLAKRLA